MIVIFSGEGPTDIGTSGTAISPCQLPDFIPGPMAVLVDIAIENEFQYSLFEAAPSLVWFISETELKKRSKQESPRKVTLRGSKGPEVETAYFHRNAHMLAQFAQEKEAELNDVSLAVLFRDHDGTRTTDRSAWEAKFKSMADGFMRAQYTRGVGMLPKPKSEAWLLCLTKNHTKKCNCAGLENISGNDVSPKSAKDQLDTALGSKHNASELVDWLMKNPPDLNHLSVMPSFARFHTQLRAAFATIKEANPISESKNSEK
jgi:hypothetical protein